MPCGAVFVDPPITGVPHARVSDPTAAAEGGGGLASAGTNLGSQAGRHWSDKKFTPHLEHRRGPSFIIGSAEPRVKADPAKHLPNPFDRLDYQRTLVLVDGPGGFTWHFPRS